MMRFRIIAAFLLSSLMICAAGIDQGLLNLVPAGTKMISGIQVDKSKDSPLGQFLMTRMQENDDGLQEFTQATNFDPRRDVQELLFASNGDPQQPQMAVIARGYFDPARIKAAAVAHGARVQSLQGIDVIVGKDKKGGRLAFLDNTLAVAGSPELVDAIVANRKSATVLDPQLEKGIRKVSGDCNAWFVSLVPGSRIPANAIVDANGQQINGAVLQSILQSSGSIRLGDTVKLSFEAVTRSDKDAQSLSDVVRFLSSMVQMQRENQPQAALLASALDTMSLNTEGNTMHLSLAVPEKVLEQLVESAPHVEKRASLGNYSRHQSR